MMRQTLPRKEPLTRANAVEVAEVAPVAPGARRSEVRGPLLTRPRRIYLQLHTEVRRDTQPAYPVRYLRYPRYLGSETPGQTVFARVAPRVEHGATQPLPHRDERD